MGSHNDMHDANGDYDIGDEDIDVVEKDDFDYNYDYADDSEDDDTTDCHLDDLEDTPNGSQINYTILRNEDIQKKQEEYITKLSIVLSIPKEAARILLRHYNWIVNKVNEEWFADEERVRNDVGILKNPLPSFLNAKKVACGICFDIYSCNHLRSAGCGHLFCDKCWTAYISTSINDGPGCLMLRCPDPSCRVAVGQDMIDKLVSDEDKEKYDSYLIRSYVEGSSKVKWCPAPDCDSAIEYDVDSDNHDVTCSCSFGFCWKCTEDAHRPVDCETVAKWILKNSSEAENNNWILAYAKPCPNCKRPIEKNQGCTHMTCSQCRSQFCWLCLSKWSGGHSACNKYNEAKRARKTVEDERREKAKNLVERYTHYYERWAFNESSRKKAIADLHQMKNTQLEELSEKQSKPVTQLKFITEAWEQIVECRRVLKWTYAYGYYLPQNEKNKKNLFEYMQGEAETGLERLHYCAEKELAPHFFPDGLPKDCAAASKDFFQFQSKLAGLTRVTRNYFENLVRALENGLPDVASQAIPSKSSTKTKGKSGNMKNSSKTNYTDVGYDYYEEDRWMCDRCTYSNVGFATTCEMCFQEEY